MSSQGNDSISKTLLVAFILCIVCAVLVAGAAVTLKPLQQKNKALDKKTNILVAAGLYQDGVPVEQQFSKVQAKVVDLATGRFTDAVDVASYDQRKASKDPKHSIKLGEEDDKAKIGRRVNYAVIYLVEDESGLDKVILPIKGYGLWSTLYGFIALNADLNTVAGIGFYEHAETPGLGGEVDNPLWKQQWIGKEVYDNQDHVSLSVIKGTVDPSNPKAIHQIDGLSGATLTSRGVDNLIHFWMGKKGFGPFLTNLQKGDV